MAHPFPSPAGKSWVRHPKSPEEWAGFIGETIDIRKSARAGAFYYRGFQLVAVESGAAVVHPPGENFRKEYYPLSNCRLCLHELAAGIQKRTRALRLSPPLRIHNPQPKDETMKPKLEPLPVKSALSATAWVVRCRATGKYLGGAKKGTRGFHHDLAGASGYKNKVSASAARGYASRFNDAKADKVDYLTVKQARELEAKGGHQPQAVTPPPAPVPEPERQAPAGVVPDRISVAGSGLVKRSDSDAFDNWARVRRNTAAAKSLYLHSEADLALAEAEVEISNKRANLAIA